MHCKNQFGPTSIVSGTDYERGGIEQVQSRVRDDHPVDHWYLPVQPNLRVPYCPEIVSCDVV